MIEIQNVSKQYGDTVVIDGVSLDLPAGGVTAIIGPNGAGKSTLLSMVSRLLPMSAGRVLVEGLDVTRADSRELARRLAILRQDNHLPLRLTVKTKLVVPLSPSSRVTSSMLKAGAVSSFWMVPVPSVSPAAAPVMLLSLTVNESLPSYLRSPLTVTSKR